MYISKIQGRILKRIYRKKGIKYDDLIRRYGEQSDNDLSRLIYGNYIIGNGEPPYTYSLGEDGIEYAETEIDKSFKFWIPILIADVIAGAALIISIIALLKI